MGNWPQWTYFVISMISLGMYSTKKEVTFLGWNFSFFVMIVLPYLGGFFTSIGVPPWFMH